MKIFIEQVFFYCRLWSGIHRTLEPDDPRNFSFQGATDLDFGIIGEGRKLEDVQSKDLNIQCFGLKSYQGL